MALDRSEQTRVDADAIYALAFEWHGAIMLEDAQALGRAWRPVDRVARAVALLVEDGFGRLETFRGKRLLRLTTPGVDELAQER